MPRLPPELARFKRPGKGCLHHHASLRWFSSDVGQYALCWDGYGMDYEPKNSKIWNVFKHIPPKVKVCVVGPWLDGDPQNSDGILYSWHARKRQQTRNKSPYESPLLIRRAYMKELGFREPTSYSLVPWVQRGILLIPYWWVTKPSDRDDASRKPIRGIGWETLTRYLVQSLSRQQKRMVFIFQGSDAVKLRSHIDQKKHLVICIPKLRTLWSDHKVFTRTAAYLNTTPEKLWRLP